MGGKTCSIAHFLAASCLQAGICNTYRLLMSVFVSSLAQDPFGNLQLPIEMHSNRQLSHCNHCYLCGIPLPLHKPDQQKLLHIHWTAPHYTQKNHLLLSPAKELRFFFRKIVNSQKKYGGFLCQLFLEPIGFSNYQLRSLNFTKGRTSKINKQSKDKVRFSYFWLTAHSCEN